MPPQTEKVPTIPSQGLGFVVADEGSAQTPVFTAPSGVISVQPSRSIRLDESWKDLTPAEVMALAMTLVTKENCFPIEEAMIYRKVVSDPSKPWPTEAQFLQHCVLRVVRLEGESLIVWLGWWRLKFISLTMLGLLSSALTTWSSIVPLVWLRNSGGVVGDFIPTLLAVAFSAGLLAQKLGSYGWRRLLRLLWVRASRNQYLRHSRESARSVFRSVESRKRR